MKNKSKTTLRAKKIFYTLLGIFILLIIYFAFPVSVVSKRAFFPFMAILGIAFFALGIALIVVARRLKEKKLRLYLILTGAAAAAVLVCVILHNLVYGLFIYLFGADFWVNIGIEDEPVFFILAIIICPVIFLIGVIGSLVQFIKKKR